MLFLGGFQNPLVFYKQKRNPPKKKKVIIAKLLLILRVLGASLYLDEEVSLLYLLGWVGGPSSSLSSLYFSFIVD
jgi:hypothetical protein